MKKNDIYFERIIRRVLKEEPTGEPTGAPSTGPTGVPPGTEEVKYYTYENKQNAGPFTVEELKNKKWNDDSYVWSEKDGTAWVQVKTIPELSTALKGGTTPANTQASPQQNTTTQTTEEKQVESFFTYCPTTKGLLDQAAKKILDLTNQAINSAESVEKAEEIRNNAFEKMGDDNKKNLGYCKSELRGSGRGDIQQLLAKFEPAIKTLLNKTAADLGKKALSGGVNLLVGLVTKKIGGVSNAVSESLIKKNTKNHLIEVYNRKNRRR